jgi:type I restriction enzyme M protein
MKPSTGRCAILFPHGVLFRDEESEMRRHIVEADLIDCVLGLGPGLFYNSPMEACVVFCQTEKPAERKGKILFINAVNERVREQGQSHLDGKNLSNIIGAATGTSSGGAFSRWVTHSEIEARDWKLAIPLYVPAQTNGGKGSAGSDNLMESVQGLLLATAAAKSAAREIVTSIEGAQGVE